MQGQIEPTLHPVEIASLRPSQMTVGMLEVERKRQQWREHKTRDGADFLGQHMVPVVIGPKGQPWLVDHHHLALALHLEGVKHVLVSVVAQLEGLDKTRFMTFMDNLNWLHPYDAEGKRCDFDDLPRKVAKLTDDPFRSLAGELREAGGYAKVATPFSEFLWADFLRKHFKAKQLEHIGAQELERALVLAHSKKANYLPGWCGRD